MPRVTRGVPTSGRIANGAIIENEIDFALDSLKNIRIALRNPDFTTARRISDAINAMARTAGFQSFGSGHRRFANSAGI